MSDDLTPFLDNWPYNPDEIQSRIVAGADGREKIQTRLDLGVIQMELDGRPDGLHPNGFESWLDALEDRATRTAAAGDRFILEPSDCVSLMREGVMYYQRYLACFHLGRLETVVRDTNRNLRLFAFVGLHAPTRQDKLLFDQYRPYVLMMRARALAQIAIESEDRRAAITAVDDGIAAVRAFLAEYGQEKNASQCAELSALVQLREEIENARPPSPLERLEEQLEKAVALEDYEEAARLRDQLRQLKPSRETPSAFTQNPDSVAKMQQPPPTA